MFSNFVKVNNKDFYRRQFIFSSENFRIALKTIQYSSYFPLRYRLFASIRLSRFRSYPTQIRNRCVLTGRSRGVYNYFKVSRIILKDLASKGLLPGLKKACW